MKLPIVFAFTFLPAIKALHCYSKTLSPNVPLRFDDPCTQLSITSATGTIGMKTFSLMSDIQELSIEYSEISRIEDGALCSPPYLEKISLKSQIYFPILTRSLLSNCGNVRYLFLENMQMEPNALKNMANLEKLYLYNQDITHLTSEYLASLNQLDTLEFQKCKIKTIDAGAICLPSKLKDLRLISNSIPPLTQSMFKNCNNVEDLRIAGPKTDSYIEPLKQDTFSGFVKVTSVRLEQINIEHLTKRHLAGLNSAITLVITQSNVTTIDTDAFENFSRLKDLYLSFNKISHIDSDVMYSLPKLDTLVLDNNTLTSIDSISNAHLRYLYASANNIAKINVTAVKENLPKLESLSISCNEMDNDYLNTIEEEFKEKLENDFIIISKPLIFGNLKLCV